MQLPPIKICRECRVSQHKVLKNIKNAVLENESNAPSELNKVERGILEDYVHKNVIKKPEHFGHIARMAIPTTKFWKNTSTITVSFLGGNKTVREKIRKHALMWMEFINIELKFVSSPKTPALIRIAFDMNDGSWSYVGTDIKTIPEDEPTMNFGWFKPDTDEEEFHRTTLHEFGHALGCIHEHQHPKGGIPWDKDKAYQYYQQQGWTKEEVDQQVFRKYQGDLIREGKIDKKSIMMYPIPEEITVGNFKVDWNNDLSPNDKKYISKVYKK